MSTTFYTIHAYNRTEDKANTNELWDDKSPYELYDTFDEACYELDRKIMDIIDVYNTTQATEEIVFEPPDKDELSDFEKEIVYYSFDNGAFVFKIRKCKVKKLNALLAF